MSNIEENTRLLVQTAENGDAVEVQRLIPVSDPKANNSAALRFASSNGHLKCVKLLIPVSNPKANNSYALQAAVENGHTRCVELLYPVSDPVVALKQLQHDYPNDYNAWGQLQHMIDAERVRNTLNAEVGTTTVVKAQRKV